MNRNAWLPIVVLASMLVFSAPPSVRGADRPVGEAGSGSGDPGTPGNLSADTGTAPQNELPVGTPADFDGDGALDAVDNCLQHPNSQRDTDQDGFGDRCDPDFDNDGDVDDQDRMALQRVQQQGPAGARDLRLMDLDEDGDVDDDDMAIVDEFMGGTPGPVQDLDGDGTPDRRDPCASTPADTLQAAPGCSLLETMQEPYRLTRPVSAAVAELAETLDAAPDHGAVVTNLRSAVGAIADAARAVADGDPCGADGPLADARGHLGVARDEIGILIMSAEGDVPPDAQDQADSTAEEMRLMHLGFEQARTDELIAETEALQGAFGTLCGSARPWTGRGVIDFVDDARRRFVLDDGGIVGFVGLSSLTGAHGPGSTLDVSSGLEFPDGTRIALSVVDDPTTYQFGQPICVVPRFAPVQPFGLYATGPYTLLDPLAYELSGKYRIEEGMRFAAEHVCPPGNQIEPQFPRYSLKLTVLFWYDPDQVNPYKEVIATDLEHGDEPVPLPDKFWDENLAFIYDRVSLQVETLRRECSILSLNHITCGNTEVIKQEEFPLELRDRGSLCVASYHRTEFEIDDQVSGAWDQTWITNITYLFPTDTPEHFEALGYEMCQTSTGWMPCTARSTIYAPNHSFTLKSWDTYPVHYVSSATTRALLREITGVERASGLTWPRLYGTHNGRTWQYSCTLPRVTRDYVDFCPGPTDAFYKLPFTQWEYGLWKCGQGNMSPAGNSHAGTYALDMNDEDGGCGDNLRAARAGVVTWVRSNSNCQNHPNCNGSSPVCGSFCCTQGEISANLQNGNLIQVRHQDDTIGLYLHLKPNGVAVQKGDIVDRGDLLGWVGTTGHSSGPHVHWESQDLNGTPHLSLFEAAAPNDPSTKMTCYEPHTGDKLRSTNWP